MLTYLLTQDLRSDTVVVLVNESKCVQTVCVSSLIRSLPPEVCLSVSDSGSASARCLRLLFLSSKLCRRCGALCRRLSLRLRHRQPRRRLRQQHHPGDRLRLRQGQRQGQRQSQCGTAACATVSTTARRHGNTANSRLPGSCPRMMTTAQPQLVMSRNGSETAELPRKGMLARASTLDAPLLWQRPMLVQVEAVCEPTRATAVEARSP